MNKIQIIIEKKLIIKKKTNTTSKNRQNPKRKKHTQSPNEKSKNGAPINHGRENAQATTTSRKIGKSENSTAENRPMRQGCAPHGGERATDRSTPLSGGQGAPGAQSPPRPPRTYTRIHPGYMNENVYACIRLVMSFLRAVGKARRGFFASVVAGLSPGSTLILKNDFAVCVFGCW